MGNTINQMERIKIICGNRFHNTREEMEVDVYDRYPIMDGLQTLVKIRFPSSSAFCTYSDCTCGRDYIITENHPDEAIDFISDDTCDNSPCEET